MEQSTDNSVAIFGGGCFWCTEAVFKMLKGVISVDPGYSGGTSKNPTYEEVSSGMTGHAEVIRIEYDASRVTYKNLLTVFFASHDSTTLNRQGNDVGTQYRSIVFFSTPEQEQEARAFIAELNASSGEGAKVVTEVVPLDMFYPAEDYHKNYFARNKDAGYCQIIINPKLEKVQHQFAELLKEHPNTTPN